MHLQRHSLICCRDDAVFDDAVVDLFPRYWEHVPQDFDFLFVGSLYPGEQQHPILFVRNHGLSCVLRCIR